MVLCDQGGELVVGGARGWWASSMWVLPQGVGAVLTLRGRLMVDTVTRALTR